MSTIPNEYEYLHDGEEYTWPANYERGDVSIRYRIEFKDGQTISLLGDNVAKARETASVRRRDHLIARGLENARAQVTADTSYLDIIKAKIRKFEAPCDSCGTSKRASAVGLAYWLDRAVAAEYVAGASGSLLEEITKLGLSIVALPKRSDELIVIF